MSEASLALSLMLRQFESISSLSDADRIELARIPLRVRRVEQGADAVVQYEKATESCILISGVLCRYKIVADSRRQILALHYAGDIPDMQSLYLGVMDHSLCALTPCVLAMMPHKSMKQAERQQPHLAEVFGRYLLIDAAKFREWIANIGRRDALQRVAHLLCEAHVRMHVAGVATGGAFNLAISQKDFADATGLSPVHISRTFRELKERGLVIRRGQLIEILNWPDLQRVADFDPTYLHLKPEAWP
ncbi:MAG: Crp/Fnr family transcriptional regulator [Caulobacterales bacterium]